MVYDTVCAKEVFIDSSQTAQCEESLFTQHAPLMGKHKSPSPEPQHSVLNVKEPKIQ